MEQDDKMDPATAFVVLCLILAVGGPVIFSSIKNEMTGVENRILGKCVQSGAATSFCASLVRQ